MSPIRKLLFVGVGVLALHGLQACASETELNPQPLPPQSGGGESRAGRSRREDGRHVERQQWQRREQWNAHLRG